MALPTPHNMAMAALAASSRLNPRMPETLTSRLETNDPSLIHLKLCRKPSSLFGDDNDGGVARFLAALRQNTVVRVVEFSWRFLCALDSVETRVMVLEAVGSLPFLEKLFLEAIGPCDALIAALEKANHNNTHLKTLWIGALRISSNHDVSRLAAVFRSNVSLEQINLYNIRLQVHGSYRLDRGRVYFQENHERTGGKVDLNPLLAAISGIPTMEKIQLDLQLKPDKMVRIRENVLRRMCQAPRISFLMLNSCNLDDDDIIAVAQELGRDTNCLQVLNVNRGNEISERGWEALAEMTETNYQLTCLCTPEDTEAATTIERTPDWSMPTNHFLATLLDPPAKPITAPSADCRTKMDFYLRLNEKGRKRLLQQASSSSSSAAGDHDWFRFLVQEINDIAVVFYVLQTVPGLFFV